MLRVNGVRGIATCGHHSWCAFGVAPHHGSAMIAFARLDGGFRRSDARWLRGARPCSIQQASMKLPRASARRWRLAREGHREEREIDAPAEPRAASISCRAPTSTSRRRSWSRRARSSRRWRSAWPSSRNGWRRPRPKWGGRPLGGLIPGVLRRSKTGRRRCVTGYGTDASDALDKRPAPGILRSLLHRSKSG